MQEKVTDNEKVQFKNVTHIFGFIIERSFPHLKKIFACFTFEIIYIMYYTYVRDVIYFSLQWFPP